MKRKPRFAALLSVLLALLMLCACGSAGTQPYTVTRDGKTYTVDNEHSTISDGTYTYAVSWSGDEVTITYPDGSTYWMHFSSGSGVGFSYGGWSDDYGPGPYEDGSVLLNVLNEQRPDRDGGGSHLLLALLLLPVGIFHVAAPETAWMLSHGWKYKNAEPSDLALAANRIGGVLCILAAVAALFV